MTDRKRINIIKLINSDLIGLSSSPSLGKLMRKYQPGSVVAKPSCICPVKLKKTWKTSVRITDGWARRSKYPADPKSVTLLPGPRQVA